MNSRYPVVCLAGSMKFADEIMKSAHDFSKIGYIVLMPFKDDREELDDKTKEMYAHLQEERIKLCDLLHVVNPDGYIGKSTMKEVQYAKELNKDIEYLVDIEPKTITLIGSRKFIREFMEAAGKFSLNGHIVHIPAIFHIPIGVELDNLTEYQHEILDNLHKKKMLQSDEIYVINPKGYIGEDTQKEIDFAKENNKRIKYLVDMRDV